MLKNRTRVTTEIDHFQIQKYLKCSLLLHFLLHLHIHLETDAVLHRDIALADVVQLDEYDGAHWGGVGIEED